VLVGDSHAPLNKKSVLMIALATINLRCMDRDRDFSVADYRRGALHTGLWVDVAGLHADADAGAIRAICQDTAS
jgi:hypothetical protein